MISIRSSREAMASVKDPTDARPSISDVHRRARRHNRRRMTATVGAVACTGVATAALLIRRDDDSTKLVASSEPDATDVPIGTLAPTTTYLAGLGGSHHHDHGADVDVADDRSVVRVGCPVEDPGRPVRCRIGLSN